MPPPDPKPFHLSAGWQDAWMAAFGGPAACEVGGLPLMRAQARVGPLRIATLRSATNPHSIHYDAPVDLVLDADLPTRIFRESGVGAIRFDYLTGDARLLAAARGWAGDHSVVAAPHALAPVVDCRRAYADWLASRSKRIRNRLRRDGGRAMNDLGMIFTVTRDDPVASGLLDEVLRLEQAGWKGAEGTAILDDPAETLFYTMLATRAAAAGALRLATLRDGDRLVAFEYGVLSGTRLFLLKVGYDETLADLSPGYVLAALHIGACCAAPDIDWYDKMGNGMTPSPYKLRYADACDTLFRATVYAPGWRGTTLLLRDAARLRGKALRDAWRVRRKT